MTIVTGNPNPPFLGTPEEYAAAVAEIDRLLEIDPKPFTADYDRLEPLADMMGGRSRVSDFFSGKRALSKGQIEALRGRLGIPADLLL